MVVRTFVVNKREFEKKPITVFQHKLRTFMNCYVIRDMLLDEIDYKVIFKKNHRINGIIMKDPKEHTVKYEVMEADNPKELILKLML